MAIYKRGRKYWYKFMFDGEPIRESTKQGNDRIAREIEAAHRSRLAKARDESEAAARRLNCESILLCPECKQWFDAETAVNHEEHAFCGRVCRSSWAKRYTVVPTLAEFCEERFESWIKSTTAQKTWLDFYRVGLRAIKSDTRLSGLKMDEITSEHAVEFAVRRRAQRGGLQVSTVNSSLRVLRRALRQAADWGLIQAAPKIKMFPGERHRERVLGSEEEARYLAASPEPLASVATLLADTGMRPEECYRLRWETITWMNGRNGTLLVTHGKTKAARRVLPLTPRVRAVLEARWENAGRPEEGWVWPSSAKSGHVEPCSLKRRHRSAIKAAKVRPFVLYSLRHTFLTRLGESGCDAWTLARIAGHSSIAISSRYVHPSEDAVLMAVERLGGHRNGHNPKRTTEAAQDPKQLRAVLSEG